MGSSVYEKAVEVGTRAVVDSWLWADENVTTPTPEEEVRAILSALSAAGLVVVPREPTQAMLDAIVTYPAELVAARNDPAYTAQMQAAALAERALAAQRYRAMIEAARVNKEGR